MEFVPWRFVADWKCNACGDCCRLFSVVINFHEWLQIVKSYGVEHTASGLNKLFIRRKTDGSCAFLRGGASDVCICELQYMKPKACQLWPFQILPRPKFGYPNEATYVFGGNRLFVYADPMCRGLRYGSPTSEFAGSTLKEFVEIAVGLRSSQLKTTSGFVFPQYRGSGVINKRRPF
jgi:Fe-S-cluster containining protein